MSNTRTVTQVCAYGTRLWYPDEQGKQRLVILPTSKGYEYVESIKSNKQEKKGDKINK